MSGRDPQGLKASIKDFVSQYSSRKDRNLVICGLAALALGYNQGDPTPDRGDLNGIGFFQELVRKAAGPTQQTLMRNVTKFLLGEAQKVLL